MNKSEKISVTITKNGKTLKGAEVITLEQLPALNSNEQNLFESIDELEQGQYLLVKIPGEMAKKEILTSKALKEIETSSTLFLKCIFGQNIKIKIIKDKATDSYYIIEIHSKPKELKVLIGRNGTMGNSLRTLFSELSNRYDGRFILEFIE